MSENLPIEGIPIDPHPNPLVYIVTLTHHDHLDSFYDHMESATQIDHVPDRACECIDRMPISRNTAYLLNHDEAIALTNDPRVHAVTLSWHHRGIEAELHSWSSSSSIIGVDFNQTATQIPWGIYRTRTKDDIQMGRPYDANLATAGTRVVSHELSGKNVDVVIVDGGLIDPQILEYRANSDGTGASRVVDFNWFIYDDAVTGGKFSTDNIATKLYTYYSDFNNGHQAHTAGTTAGNTKGLARDADIYNIEYLLYYGYGPDNDWSSQLYPYQFIKQWHLNKKVNPFTGRKNPTVTNNSWGFALPLNSVYRIKFAPYFVYRGETVYPTSGDATIGTASYSNADMDRMGFAGKVNVPMRDAPTDADILDLAAAGVINVVSAGNSYFYCDTPDGPDYNNYFAMYTTVTIKLTGPVTFNTKDVQLVQKNRPIGDELIAPRIEINSFDIPFSGTTDTITGKIVYTLYGANVQFDLVNPLSIYSLLGGFIEDLDPINSVPVSVTIGGLTPYYYHRGSSPGGANNGDLSPIVVGAMGATFPGFMRDYIDGGAPHYGNTPTNTSLHQGNYKSEFSNYGPRVDVYAPGAVTVSVYTNDGTNAVGPAGQPGTYNSSIILADPREATFDPLIEDVGNLFARNSAIGQDPTDLVGMQYSRNIMEAIAGTSMAGPHVTGVLACLLERNPGWTQKDARAWIAAHSPESMISTSGGTMDETDLGLNRNPKSNKKLLYLPSSRFLDDTPNSTPTSGFKNTPFPSTTHSYRSTTGQTYPRNNNRSVAPIVPLSTNLTFSIDVQFAIAVGHTPYRTETNVASGSTITQSLDITTINQVNVIFTVQNGSIPDGTKIPYSTTNREYENLGKQWTANMISPVFFWDYSNGTQPKNFGYDYVTFTNNIGIVKRWFDSPGPVWMDSNTSYRVPFGFQIRLIAPTNPCVNLKYTMTGSGYEYTLPPLT